MLLSYKASEDADYASEGILGSDIISGNAANNDFPDRQHVERSLLRKLDLRMSILILIYTLNYVSRVATQPCHMRLTSAD